MNLRVLSSDQLRALHRDLQRENRSYPEHLVEVPVPPCPFKVKCVRAWRSRDFLVQQYDENGRIRLSINRTAIDIDAKDYKDGISWDDLQRLKRESGYGDYDAVEVYPKDKDMVYDANLRHLWIIEPLPVDVGTPTDIFHLVPMIWRKK